VRKSISIGLTIAFLQFFLPITVLTQPAPPPISKAIESEQGFTYGVIVSPHGKSGQESLQVQVPPNIRAMIISLVNVSDQSQEAKNVMVTVQQPNGNIIGKEANRDQAIANAGLKKFPPNPRLDRFFENRREHVRIRDPFPQSWSPDGAPLEKAKEDEMFAKEIEAYMKNIENQKMMGNVIFPKQRVQNKGLAHLTIHGPIAGAWTIHVKAVANPTPYQVTVILVPKNKLSGQLRMQKVSGVLTKVEAKIKEDYPLYSPWGCDKCCSCKNYVKAIASASFLIGFAALVSSGGLAAYAGAWGTLGEIYYALAWVYGFYVGMAKFVLTIVDWALGSDTYGIFWGFPQQVCKMFRRC
jgi:hypothetical protein